MIETGVIHGRFQVLHNDHMTYLLAGRERCRHLVVGVTNPDPTLTRPDAADPARSEPFANPLTYWERSVMVRSALREAGVADGDLSVVPLPINLPDLYGHYVPLDATFFLTIYDDWGRRKLERFRELGLRTDVMWERPPERKGLSASDVRLWMAEGGPWREFVPPAARRLLEEWDIPARLQRIIRDSP